MKFIPHLIFLLTAFSLIADEKSEKLLNLAGFTSHSSKKLQLNGFGSGFAVTSDGYVITASHVIEGSDAVRVIFKDGKSYDAKVVKEERGLDLAILKIDAKTPAFLSVSSRTAGLGDDIYTIGYPSPLLLGTNQKFTKGSISALTGLKNDSFRYQISVPIQPGNSGGAVVSEETGEVVGIVVSSLKGKEVVGFNPQNVNYALKSGFIRPILDALEIKSEKVKAAVNKNVKRQRVVDAACMIVTCKLKIKEDNEKSNPIIPNPPEARNKDKHSLILVAVGPINRLIVIDEGEDSKVFEFTSLDPYWKKELQFSTSFRLFCSSLENLRFSVDGGGNKMVEGSGSGQIRFRPPSSVPKLKPNKNFRTDLHTEHTWTDNTGRTLLAKFVKYENGVVHLIWNSRRYPIPDSSLSFESRQLARRLQSGQK